MPEPELLLIYRCISRGTPLPVIGIPINATALQGVDALYAMVQMPSGVPVR